MIKLLAETPNDQDMLDKFQRAYENLKKIVDRLEDENRRLRQELEEYKKRHPSNVGVKNGKTYDIAVSGDEQSESMIPEPTDKRKQGAQPGHTAHFRIRKRPTEKSTVHLDLNECPECHSSLRRKGSRKRIIEDIPIIKTKIIEYRMDRLYCSKCHRIYEPNIPDVLPNATLSLRAMLTVAYFRIGMRMSIENVSATMMNVFGIRISEGGIQNILSQLSDSLGREYSSLLQAIRDAPSRHMDSTSWRIDGNPYNLWTFLTRSEAIFHISKGNGHEVTMDILRDHKGTDIHDRHSAFETFASKTSNDQQYCWSFPDFDANVSKAEYLSCISVPS